MLKCETIRTLHESVTRYRGSGCNQAEREQSCDGARETVLLTGSEGGLGIRLSRRLLEQGYTVRGLDLRAASGTGEHVVADLLDLNVVRAAMEGVTAVVHAGAIPWDREDGSQVVSTNVLGTWNVLQAAVEAGVERFVGLSSINAQGSSGGWRRNRLPPHRRRLSAPSHDPLPAVQAPDGRSLSFFLGALSGGHHLPASGVRGAPRQPPPRRPRNGRFRRTLAR